MQKKLNFLQNSSNMDEATLLQQIQTSNPNAVNETTLVIGDDISVVEKQDSMELVEADYFNDVGFLGGIMLQQEYIMFRGEKYDVQTTFTDNNGEHTYSIDFDDSLELKALFMLQVEDFAPNLNITVENVNVLVNGVETETMYTFEELNKSVILIDEAYEIVIDKNLAHLFYTGEEPDCPTFTLNQNLLDSEKNFFFKYNGEHFLYPFETPPPNQTYGNFEFYKIEDEVYTQIERSVFIANYGFDIMDYFNGLFGVVFYSDENNGNYIKKVKIELDENTNFWNIETNPQPELYRFSVNNGFELVNNIEPEIKLTIKKLSAKQEITPEMVAILVQEQVKNAFSSMAIKATQNDVVVDGAIVEVSNGVYELQFDKTELLSCEDYSITLDVTTFDPDSF